MKELKTYYCTDVPNDDEIQEAIRITRTQHCLVSLVWTVFYNSYRVLVQENDTVESVHEKMPKVYGL